MLRLYGLPMYWKQKLRIHCSTKIIKKKNKKANKQVSKTLSTKPKTI